MGIAAQQVTLWIWISPNLGCYTERKLMQPEIQICREYPMKIEPIKSVDTIPNFHTGYNLVKLRYIREYLLPAGSVNRLNRQAADLFPDIVPPTDNEMIAEGIPF